ncbi:helix-turn-helix domain-containing protein [Paenibacillus paridis]|uniref:helix-turn-helix domain-containing protein n=1 Tax=Paenibacillus paridis TaxID=2583376 RepID=UPI001390DEC5|nr:helix-turn-helix domain-containing protein [Paenibacillus paridis]
MQTIHQLWTEKIWRLRMITVLLLLSILPVIGFGTFVYVMGTDIVKSETHRSSFTVMNQMSLQMDAALAQIEQFTTQLAMQTNLINLTKIKQSPGLGTLVTSNDLKSDLNAFVGSVNGVDSVDFFHVDQNMIISSRGMFSLENGYYSDLSWLPYIKEAQENKLQSFWIAPRTAVSLEKQEYKVITHARLLPILYSEAKAVLLVNMKQDYLRSLIGHMPEGAEGSILVFNGQQEIIAQEGSMPLNDSYREKLAAVIQEKLQAGDGEWDKKTYKLFEPELFVTFKKSEDHDWVYAMLIPVDSVSQNTLLLKRVIIISTAILSLLALITAYFSFSKLQRGIQRLLGLFDSGASGSKRGTRLQQHDYTGQVQYIADNIAHLMNEVVEVRASWKEQLPLLRAHYLLSAIVGNMSSLDKLVERYNKEFELFQDPLFAVHIVEMDTGVSDARFSEQDLPLFLFAASNIINELFAQKYRVETVITHDHVIVIFNLPARASGTFVEEAAEQIREEIKRFTRHTVTIGTGRCVAEFRELSVSYHEALRALRLNWLKLGDKVLAGGTSEGLTNKLVSYPSFAEEELLDQIRRGDTSAIPSALQRFMSEITRHSLPFHMTKTYYLQLLVAMIRLAQEYEEDLSLVFQGTNPYDDFFKLDEQSRMAFWFEQKIVPPIIRLIHSSRRQRKEEIVGKTFRLVEERYAQDLSLQLLAEELNMNPSYVSLIFKEETGDTFINYVTRFRVDKAKGLLNTTELTIAQIAKEVGYANAQHLIRVFKKLESCTPGEYRSAAP